MNVGLRNDIKFSITNCLIALYIIIFILEKVNGEGASMYYFALNGYTVIDLKEYWRLFTNAFLHADIFHLFMNSSFIFLIGNGVEAMLGKTRYLALVIFTILSSSAVIVLWDWQTGSQGFTIGASGFGFGLVGLLAGFAIMYPGRYYGKYLRDLFINIGIYALLFMMMGVNVSWAGHIGGFVGGLIIALVLNVFFRKKEW